MDKQNEHYLKTELYEKLRTDPTLFEWLEQGSLDGIWYWDLVDGNQEWLSPKFNQLFGYKPNEIPHTAEWWQAHIFPDDLALALENFNQHVADPSHPYDQIVRYRHKDGSTVWVRCRGLVMRDENGTPIRMLGAHTDVTSLKKAELQLSEQRTKLEEQQSSLAETNQALERFAVIVSHDLKEPARSAGKLIKWVLEDHADVLPEDAKAKLIDAEQRMSGMQRMLNNLLNYSRASIKDSDAETFSLADVTHSLLREQDPEGRFTLHVNDVKVTLPLVPLQTVLRNLLANVVRHHDKDKGTIAVTCQTHADRYFFCVGDDGPGLSMAKRQQLQSSLDNPSVRKLGKKSGIGLSIVNQSLQTYGSRLTIVPNSGRGLQFTFDWPIKAVV